MAHVKEALKEIRKSERCAFSSCIALPLDRNNIIIVKCNNNNYADDAATRCKALFYNVACLREAYDLLALSQYPARQQAQE